MFHSGMRNPVFHTLFTKPSATPCQLSYVIPFHCYDNEFYHTGIALMYW